MGLAAGSGHLRSRTGPRDHALRKARVCYNHLAGDLGIRLFDSLVSRGFLRTRSGALCLSKAGHAFANDFGIDVGNLLSRKVPLCRECLDWSARRSHLAGSLGRAFLSRFEEKGWAKRERGTRVVRFSPLGEKAFARMFPV
jgi:hypothetical protein